jgi:hypothetical protein
VTGKKGRSASPRRRAMALARVSLVAALLVCTAPGSSLGVAAAERPVDLQLVLAVDASGSVDARRFELQRRGYAEAFANPRILRAIRSGALRAIAVTMFQPRSGSWRRDFGSA